LLCGLLAQIYGWHAGFGLAGLLMLAGLATYASGYRHLPESSTRIVSRAEATPIDAAQWRMVFALFAVMALSVFQSIAYYQNSNIGLIWIDKFVDLDLLGLRIPVSWFNSIDSFVSIVSVPVLFALWRYQEKRGGEPGEIAKIATGAWMAAGANLLLAAGCALSPRVSVIFPVVYDIILGVAFLYYWPTLLALVSRGAPPRLKSTLMGFAFLTLFLSNTTIGRIGALYEQMSPAQFWTLHAAIAAIGGVLALLLARPLGRILNGEPSRSA